jgi:predicted nucleic acid-binding protein
MKVAEVSHSLHLSRDPKDDMYLSPAKTVSADFLVTGDLDLLSITKEKLKTVGLERLSIVTPRVFLERAKK